MRPLFPSKLDTDLNQVLLGIFVAAGCGAAVFPTGWLLLEGFHSIGGGTLDAANLASGLAIDLVAYLLAAIVWAFAISWISGPVWWILHILGLRGWPWAMLLGALTLAGFIAVADPGLFTGELVRPATNKAVAILAGFAGLGGALGVLIWRIAYRPTSTTSDYPLKQKGRSLSAPPPRTPTL